MSFDFEIQNPSQYPFFIFLKGILVSSFVVFMYMFFSKNKKVETTYSFILKTQSLSVLTGLIALLMFFTTPKELNGINVGLFCTFIFSTYSYFHFYKKHKKVTDKNQLV